MNYKIIKNYEKFNKKIFKNVFFLFFDLVRTLRSNSRNINLDPYNLPCIKKKKI